MDYKVIVRSYGRPNKIRDMTAKFLEIQTDIDLEKSLYFVVHESELSLYEESLKEVKKAGFIVKTKKGGNESVRAAREYFADGTPLVFIDDDLISLVHFEDKPQKNNKKRLDCLGKYIEDAFKTLSEIGAESWTISNSRNPFWISGKPWKEFRPSLMIGGFWGAFNSDLLLTRFSHEDDQERTSHYIEKFGGTLIYNWVLDETPDERFDGGMQLSADRASVERTLAIIQELWETDESYRKYHNPPSLNKHFGLHTSKLKSLTQIRKMRPFTHRIWNSYFSEECVVSGQIVEEKKAEEKISVLDLFG